jgi:3-hydroxyisobutyrate dehydrogenase-like beta-hydroxyacid dehydrogenase
MTCRIALIGFGEAGSTFARAAGWGQGARGWDSLDARRAAMAGVGVAAADSASDALAGAPIVLSLVTADQALAAAEAAADSIFPGALWCDMNSVAPETKRAAAAVIEAAGGRYVDVAVMSPVSPAELAVPLLISGPHAQAAETALAQLGFTNLRCVGAEIGRGSTIKMLRSVMYKGVEALTAECLIACERAGVTSEVLGSFGNDWSSGADYRLDRMLVHGERRSAEMAEVVKTLEGLGVEPLMTRGAVVRQAAIGGLGIKSPPEGLDAKLGLLT